MKNTKQQKFWQSNFGQEYTERNNYGPKQLDDFYRRTYGLSRSQMNNDFLVKLQVGNILEVGCNAGNQLRLMQKHGFDNLHGLELQSYAVRRAKELTQDINIIQGSAFDLPFKDNYFDLVFTSGVLIHINPKDLKKVMAEIYRVSKKYIWGFEYFSEKHQAINYRGNVDYLWKGDFAKMYLKFFPKLKLLKEKKYKYLASDNLDVMFLLKK